MARNKRAGLKRVGTGKGMVPVEREGLKQRTEHLQRLKDAATAQPVYIHVEPAEEE